MFSLGLGQGRWTIDPLFLLLAALVIEAYVGEMAFLYRFVRHPVVVIGGWISRLEEKLNRPQRGETDRRLRGLFTVAVILAACAAIGWLVAWFGRHYPFGWAVEMFLTVSLLAQRSLYDHVRAVASALDAGGLDAGRAAVSHIVGRDPERLDHAGVSRAAIESCAENFSDGIVAPVFWYVLFGFPGLLVYKAANTMDSMIGHRSERYRAFGMAAARLDDLLNLIPARLAGLYLVLAAFFAPTANPWRAVVAMLRDAGKHRSPNAGWPESAMAGALGLALAGPRHYREQTVDDPWLHAAGRREATARDIRRALYLYAVACLINGLLVGAAAILRMG